MLDADLDVAVGGLGGVFGAGSGAADRAGHHGMRHVVDT